MFQGQWWAFQKNYLSSLPVLLEVDEESHDRLVAHVTRILELHRRLGEKGAAHDAEREALERESRETDRAIDALVYDLCGLTVAEPRLVAWLLIMSCFWLMMYQVWDLHPNFITDWVDSSAIATTLSGGSGASFWASQTARGLQVPQELMLNINPLLIVLLVIPVSWLVRHMRTLSAMLIGMAMATAGTLVAGLTANGWMLVLGIVFFSLGEMLTGPKKNEYLGLIAPPGKKGLYLGYVNIPVGIGGFVGSKIAGHVYGNYGEKAVLALKYIASHTPYGESRHWDGSVDTLEATLQIARPQAFTRLMELTGHDAVQATQLLWDTYQPQYAVWLPFAAIGVVAIVALAIFGRLARRWSDMNA